MYQKLAQRNRINTFAQKKEFSWKKIKIAKNTQKQLKEAPKA